MRKWLFYYGMQAERPDLVGRWVSGELLRMDRPHVATAFARAAAFFANARRADGKKIRD